MKLNFNPNQTFKSIPIYDVKVKQKTDDKEEFVDATFSELTKEDLPSLDKLPVEWTQDPFIYIILEHLELFDCPQFYSVELKSDAPLQERLLSVAEKSGDEILFFQSKPKIKGFNDYSGAGVMMLYGLAKQQKEQGADELYWTSATGADKFYNHVGKDLFNSYCSNFSLPQNNYDEFLNRLEAEYHIDTKA